MKTLNKPERLRRACKQRNKDDLDHGLVADAEANGCSRNTQQVAMQDGQSYTERAPVVHASLGREPALALSARTSPPMGGRSTSGSARSDHPSPWVSLVVAPLRPIPS